MKSKSHQHCLLLAVFFSIRKRQENEIKKKKTPHKKKRNRRPAMEDSRTSQMDIIFPRDPTTTEEHNYIHNTAAVAVTHGTVRSAVQKGNKERYLTALDSRYTYLLCGASGCCERGTTATETTAERKSKTI